MSRSAVPRVLGVLMMIAILAGACSEPQDQPVTTSESSSTSPSPVRSRGDDPAQPGAVSGLATLATTAGDGSGNRLVPGRASLLREPIVVSLENPAEWVVGIALEGGVSWVVADADGRLTGYRQRVGGVEMQELDVPALPPGTPPSLSIRDGVARVFDPLAAAADLADALAVAPFAGHLEVGAVPVLVLGDGTVVIDGRRVPGVVALPDTRIVVSDDGLLALLTDPTEDLAHAVLGDAIEASSVTIVDPVAGESVGVVVAPTGAVFEALSPMWADVDGDGEEEILVTASSSADGARVMAFETDGTPLARSAAIGIGNRWLNLLGAGPVGPSGEIEVVEVKTPHIGGIVQWYRIDEGALRRTASASGYSTHGIFSRNLDEGVIVDADGDGHLDVLVPTQDDRRLVALRRVADGVEVVASVDLGADLSSNIVAVARGDGTVSLAAATEDARLLIWP